MSLLFDKIAAVTFLKEHVKEELHQHELSVSSFGQLTYWSNNAPCGYKHVSRADSPRYAQDISDNLPIQDMCKHISLDISKYDTIRKYFEDENSDVFQLERLQDGITSVLYNVTYNGKTVQVVYARISRLLSCRDEDVNTVQWMLDSQSKKDGCKSVELTDTRCLGRFVDAVNLFCDDATKKAINDYVG